MIAHFELCPAIIQIEREFIKTLSAHAQTAKIIFCRISGDADASEIHHELIAKYYVETLHSDQQRRIASLAITFQLLPFP